MAINVGGFSFEDPVGYGEKDDLGGDGSLRRTIYMGITGISWAEQGDKPCDVTVRATSLESTIFRLNSRSKEICTDGTADLKTVRFSSYKNYLRGIAACTTDRKSSSNVCLKGISIYPAEVSSYGSVKELNTYEEVKHSSCAEWFSPVFCPSGYVASGLKLSLSGGSFQGLGLMCRQITTATSPYKP